MSDRILGSFCMILTLMGLVTGFTYRSASWPILLLLSICTIGLGVWTFYGWKKELAIGWNGQLLFLGKRVSYFFEEGRHFAPWPFGINPIDCREVIMKLETLEAITKDGAKVLVDGTITYHVVDLHKRANVKDTEIKQGIDDARDQIIRVEVANTDLDEVLKMHSSLGEKMHLGLEKSSTRWGIKIIEVMITKVIPDPKIAEDLELETREKLQKKGQLVEAQNIASLITLFTRATPDGPGLNPNDAKEMAQLITGKANPKNITGFTFSPELMEAVTAIVKGKNEPN